jgi:hypothetical protein
VIAAQQALDSGAAERTVETFVQRTVELAG